MESIGRSRRGATKEGGPWWSRPRLVLCRELALPW